MVELSTSGRSIGSGAGQNFQGIQGIAIGYQAANIGQDVNGIAIGALSGASYQGFGAIAIASVPPINIRPIFSCVKMVTCFIQECRCIKIIDRILQ